MARFRFHRGTLKESLKTEIHVDCMMDIALELDPNIWDIHSLTCEYYGRDNRRDGYPQTYIICGECIGQIVPIGFSDEMLRY